MTWSELQALRAELLSPSSARVPEEGWQEISIETLKLMTYRAGDKLKAAENVRDYLAARRLERDLTLAVPLAELGRRVFTVALENDRLFAATGKAKKGRTG